MIRGILSTVIALLFCQGPALHAGDQDPKIERLLTQFCLDCHDAETSKADINLSRWNSQDAFLKDRRVWKRALEMMESGEMPPKKKTQPSAMQRERLVDWVQSSLSNVDWEAVRAPGRMPPARLTRAEYEYSVEDLFGIDVDLDDVLVDDPEGLSGFANDRSSLVMTSKQFSRYLKAAQIVAATVVDGFATEPFVIHYEVEEGRSASWKKNPTKSKAGAAGWTLVSKLGNKYQAVRKAFNFPRTGQYRVHVRAHSTGPGPNAGLWLAVDSVNDASREVGVLVTNRAPAIYETHLFVTAGRHDLIFGYDFYRPLWLPDPPERPQVKLGQSTFHPPPYDRAALLPEGITLEDLVDGKLTVPEENREAAIQLLKIINEGYFTAVLDRLMMNKFHYEKGYLPVFLGGLSYEYTENVRPAFDKLAKLLGTKRSALESIWKGREPVAFLKLEKYLDLQKEAWTSQDKSRKSQIGDLFVDWIELESIESKTGRQPVKREQVSKYLDRILPRALRRPVAVDERDRYRELYDSERDAGANHSQALQRTLTALLISPDFLYRNDGPPPRIGVNELDQHALAARLAGLLWISIPDGPLMKVSRKRKLHEAETLEKQLDRMLDDPRSFRLAELFTQQWLDLNGLGREKEPDKELFRYFSWHLAEDMRMEVALLFDRMLRENRSVLELLDGTDTFVNERLARLYDIEGISGAEFRAVALKDRRRGGLLGSAAILSATSLATRTSPVRRGQFVLETLLGVDLPPPPANVPELAENAGESKELSVRKSLALHRDNPSCAGCHSKIDPLGFALENFDWIGRWREKDPSGPVDASGALPNGRQLNGIADLKSYLVKERADDFLRALTESMLAFALGRELEYFDEHAIRGIVEKTRSDGYHARTLLKAIVQSYPFRHREITPEDLALNAAQTQN